MSSLSASESVQTSTEAPTPAPAGAPTETAAEAVAAAEVVAEEVAKAEVVAEAVEAAETAISIQDLYLTYRVNTQKVPTFKSLIARRRSDKRAIREVQALRGVSFDVPRGTVMGVIGANGAGKSTLMRTVAGILPPTEGRIEVTGRVSTLLALGVGFNATLTGRENVTLGGLAAGLSRSEIKQRYDEISEFAELGDFMELPMRTYSSGMYGRLAFSVAVHMNPDILIIDEALSTGDGHFKEKAQKKMADLIAQASTMLLVSHGMATIREMCDQVVWLHKGKVMAQGPTNETIDAYMSFIKVGNSAVVNEDL